MKTLIGKLLSFPRKWSPRAEYLPRELTPIIALLVILPLFTTKYIDMLLGNAIIFMIFAMGFDLAWGYGGILSLGHSAFFGLGAYTFAISAIHLGSGSIMVLWMILALLLPAFLAAVTGWFLFYTKSSPFFIGVVTLSLSLLAEKLVLRIPQWTGGQNGLTGFPTFPFPEKVVYYILLGAFLIILIVAYRLTRSDFGKLLIAVRDNELRAKFLGYDTRFILTLIFILSGLFSGLAGMLYALSAGFVGPSLLSFVFAAQVIIWVAIGGKGSILGAILGAFVINLLNPIFNEMFPNLWQIFLGFLFILAVVFFPNGLYAFWKRPEHLKYELILATQPMKQEIELASKRTDLHEIMQISDLNVEFGAVSVLKEVDLPIYGGKLQFLIGPNGAGKTTLINAITRRIKSNKGRILFEDIKLEGLLPHQIVRLGVGRTFQSTNLFATLTVADNLQLAAFKGKMQALWKCTREIVVSQATHNFLKHSALIDKLTIKAGQLSHGDQQALELSMVLNMEPTILLLDEPTAGLTLDERKTIGRLFIDLVRREGFTLLVIEHDIDFVKEIADRVTVLYAGRIIADGSFYDITNNPLVREIYLGAKA